MTKDEMKNRISFALKDPILQQGFEIICNEDVKLKEDYECLEDAHNVLNELYEKLEKENAELKHQIEIEKTARIANVSRIYDLEKENAELKGIKDVATLIRPQWHDLRKDPNDLPKEENRIMLCYCYIGYHGNIGTYVYRLYTKKEFHKVIAWCEIPTFDKE